MNDRFKTKIPDVSLEETPQTLLATVATELTLLASLAKATNDMVHKAALLGVQLDEEAIKTIKGLGNRRGTITLIMAHVALLDRRLKDQGLDELELQQSWPSDPEPKKSNR